MSLRIFVKEAIQLHRNIHLLKGDEDYYEDWMENYFQTYINRDVKKLFPKLNSIKYRRFIGMLSELSGTIINNFSVSNAGFHENEPAQFTLTGVNW